MTKYLFPILSLTFLALGACQEPAEPIESIDTTDLNFDGKFEGMFDSQVVVDFKGMTASEKDQALSDFLQSLSAEVEDLKSIGELDDQHFLFINLQISTDQVTLVNTAREQVIGPKTNASADFGAPLPFAPDCPSGYDRTVCYSESCVEETVAEAFGSLSGAGACMDVRVILGYASASVCTKSC